MGTPQPRGPLVRSCGLALILGGLIAAASPFLGPHSDAASVTLGPAWVPMGTLFTASNILIGYGLLGLYLEHAGRLGALGLVAFAVSSIATALSVAVSSIEAYVFPAIAGLVCTPDTPGDLTKLTCNVANVPAYTKLACPPDRLECYASPNGPLPLFAPLDNTFFLLYTLGYVLLAGLLVWRQARPRGAAWVFLAGCVLSDALRLPPAFAPLAVLGMLLFGIGLAWFGVALVAESAPT